MGKGIYGGNDIMTIGIVGYGVVGKAVEHMFKDKHTVIAYDKNAPSNSLELVCKESDFIFVCVPTPPQKNGRCDLSIIRDVLANISYYVKGTGKIVVIKSTVPPETTDFFSSWFNGNLVFNPEFLTEANPFEPSDRIILGGKDGPVKQVAKLYEGQNVLTMSATEAEMVKYMSNCFLATKVIFANEMYDICNALQVNYYKVKDGVAADTRIGASHLDVTRERGFAGKCLPKDIRALIYEAKQLGVDTDLLNSVWRKNKKIRVDFS